MKENNNNNNNNKRKKNGVGTEMGYCPNCIVTEAGEGSVSRFNFCIVTEVARKG